MALVGFVVGNGLSSIYIVYIVNGGSGIVLIIYMCSNHNSLTSMK